MLPTIIDAATAAAAWAWNDSNTLLLLLPKLVLTGMLQLLLLSGRQREPFMQCYWTAFPIMQYALCITCNTPCASHASTEAMQLTIACASAAHILMQQKQSFYLQGRNHSLDVLL